MKRYQTVTIWKLALYKTTAIERMRSAQHPRAYSWKEITLLRVFFGAATVSAVDMFEIVMYLCVLKMLWKF